MGNSYIEMSIPTEKLDASKHLYNLLYREEIDSSLTFDYILHGLQGSLVGERYEQLTINEIYWANRMNNNRHLSEVKPSCRVCRHIDLIYWLSLMNLFYEFLRKRRISVAHKSLMVRRQSLMTCLSERQV